MRRIRRTTALFACLASLTASAQVEIGVKGGLNLTELHYPYDDTDDMENQAGFFIGPMVKVGLPKGFAVDGSILYDQRSTKITPAIAGGIIYPTTIKQQQLVVPINLRYGKALSKTMEAYVFAGPQIGINVGDKTIYTCYADWNFTKANISINMGLGVTLLRRWQVSANYNLACSKSASLNINEHLGGMWEKTVGNGKLSAWQVSLGYYF